MEKGNKGNNWNEFLNKFISIIYDDFGNFPKKKEGILISFTETHLFLKRNDTNKTEAIQITKILRVEENEQKKV